MIYLQWLLQKKQIPEPEADLLELLSTTNIPGYLNIPEFGNVDVRKELQKISIQDFIFSEDWPGETINEFFKEGVEFSYASANNILKLIKKRVDEARGEYFPVIAIDNKDIDRYWPEDWEELRSIERSGAVETIIQEMLKTGNRPVIGDRFPVDGMWNELIPSSELVYEVKKVQFVPLKETPDKFLTWVLLEDQSNNTKY